MIWDSIPTDGFADAYSAYLLALQGAVDVATEALRARNPRLSIVKGNKSVETAVNGSRANVMFHARMAVADAYTRAATDSAGQVDPSQQAVTARQLEQLIGSLFTIDAMSASTTIRNQALTYDIAYRVMKHDAAFLKATGNLDNRVFSQLDRARRRFGSLDLATGYVRMGAAQTYLNAFATLADAQGIVQARLKHPEQDPRVVNLEELKSEDFQKLFHPNTRYELEVA